MSLIKRLKKVLKTMPFKFQREGIIFIKRSKGKTLLADDMGLGKTLQVLGWLAVNPSKRPVIIVTPANAKYNWVEQIKQHTYMNYEVLFGQTPFPISKSIVIINYDILTYWKNQLIKMKPFTLILDECHYAKNRRTKRTKACREIAYKVKHIIAMSGTPIINRPIEFFPVLNMINNKEFSSFWKYAMRYCNPKRGFQGRGWDFNGASHLNELRERIQSFFIRRMKKEVMTELPKKRRTILPIEINNLKEYQQAKINFLKWYKVKAGNKAAKRAKKAQALVKLGQLKQLTAEGKLKRAYEWIDDFLFNTDEKLVIFVYHRIIFNILTKRYKKFAAIGGKAGKERQLQVKKFQTNSKYRLFIGTIKADKESITLTASSTVLFLELGWTPSEHDQAEDRVNRIGQTDNKLNIYYLLGKNTIDQYIWEVIEKKRKIITKIIDGKSQSHLQTNISDIIQLLKG